MPALTFLAVVGLVLVGLLFVADATLENGPPPIDHRSSPVTALVCHPDGGKTLTTIPAPAPDMTSDVVLSAEPKAAIDNSAKIAAARAARAEAPPKIRRVTQPIDYPQNTNLFDRFSIKGQ